MWLGGEVNGQRENLPGFQGLKHRDCRNLPVLRLVPCSSKKWSVQLPSPSEARPHHDAPPQPFHDLVRGPSGTLSIPHPPVPVVPRSPPRFLCRAWWIPAATFANTFPWGAALQGEGEGKGRQLWGMWPGERMELQQMPWHLSKPLTSLL